MLPKIGSVRVGHLLAAFGEDPAAILGAPNSKSLT